MLGDVPVFLGGAFPQWVVTRKLRLEDICEKGDNQDIILRLLELYLNVCNCLVLRVIKSPLIQSLPIIIKGGAGILPKKLIVAGSGINIFVISAIGILVGVLCCGWLLHFVFAGLLMISGTECICWGQRALKLIGSWLASRHCSCGLLKQFLVCKSLFWCYSLGSRTRQPICVRSQDTLWSVSIGLCTFMFWKVTF